MLQEVCLLFVLCLHFCQNIRPSFNMCPVLLTLWQIGWWEVKCKTLKCLKVCSFNYYSLLIIFLTFAAMICQIMWKYLRWSKPWWTTLALELGAWREILYRKYEEISPQILLQNLYVWLLVTHLAYTNMGLYTVCLSMCLPKKSWCINRTKCTKSQVPKTPCMEGAWFLIPVFRIKFDQ